MPWAKKPPLPTEVGMFEQYMNEHPGISDAKPVHAPIAWRAVTTSLGYRLPHGMHKAERARRRMLKAVR